MSALTKVSMDLTQRDIKNTKSVRQLFHVHTNAEAVSAALGIARSLGEMVENCYYVTTAVKYKKF